MALSQPRIAGGSLSPAGSSTSGAAPEVTTLSVSTLPATPDYGPDWWKFTATETGTVNFDAMLSYRYDEERSTFNPNVDVYAFRESDLSTSIAASGTGVDPEQGLVLRGSLALPVIAGVTYYIALLGGPSTYRILRVSDYAETTDWSEMDDTTTVTRPDVNSTAIGWADVTVIPDEVLFRRGNNNAITYTSTLAPRVDRRHWYGRAGMDHYPQFIGDPLYNQHPYQFPANWEAIFAAALLGPASNAYDGGPSPHNWTYATPNFAEQGYPELPIGLYQFSSAVDTAPPDGHQDILDELYAYHNVYNLKRMTEGTGGTFTGPVHQAVYAADIPTGGPGGGATLAFEEPTPTVKQIELAAARRVDSPYNADLYAAFRWCVGINPLEFEGTRDPDTGHWRIGPEFTDPDIGSTGLAFRGYDVVDDQIAWPPDDDIEDTLHVYGGEPPAVRGTEVARVDGDDTAWTVVVDETQMLDLHANESQLQYPGGPDFDDDLQFTATHGYGGLMIAGIPNFVLDAMTGPDGGYNQEQFLWNLFQYPALRLTWHRPRYRWVFPPIIPPVTTGFFSPRRGWPRHQATTAARGVGGRDDIQTGPRGIGAVV